MALISNIKTDLKQAMLDKNELVRDTIRMFLAEVQRFEIDNKEEVDDAKALQIINKMIKQRSDSISQFKQGRREDLAKKEQQEVDILSKYKPEQLSEEEITEKVKNVIIDTGAESMQDIGKVMGELKKTHSDEIDFAKAGPMIKDLLNK